MLALLQRRDRQLRWHTTVANRDAAVLEGLLFHPLTLPGFTDSGAHVGNLAFFDGHLRTLKIAQSRGLERVARAVQRLTLPASGLLQPRGRAAAARRPGRSVPRRPAGAATLGP